MIVRKEIDLKKPLTEEQKRALKELEARPVQSDEDCPELTPDMLCQVQKISTKQEEHRK